MKKLINAIFSIIVIVAFGIGGLWLAGIFDPRDPFIPSIDGYEAFYGQEIENAETRKEIFESLGDNLGDTYIITSRQTITNETEEIKIDYTLKRDQEKYYIKQIKTLGELITSQITYYEIIGNNLCDKYQQHPDGSFTKSQTDTNEIFLNQEYVLELVLRTIKINPVPDEGFTNAYTFADGEYETSFKVKDEKIVLTKQIYEDSKTTITLFEYTDVTIDLPVIE